MDTSTGGRFLKTVEAAGDVKVERAFVGAVSARDVHLKQSAAGPVMAAGAVWIERGGCGPLMTAGNVSIERGGCGPVIAGGDVSFVQGGAQTVISAGSATIGERACVGLLVSPRVTIEDGAHVVMSTPQALAFGAAAGTIIGLMIRGRRRSR
jgi:hypothetical protein